ncbi:hypothetical protein BKA82DRAFT_4017597 [Pisolithus tinctorius]|nr:hypothetical protein BKA82DRAFT_4017597 [Pisolithus tinctorius]
MSILCPQLAEVLRRSWPATFDLDMVLLRWRLAANIRDFPHLQGALDRIDPLASPWTHRLGHLHSADLGIARTSRTRHRIVPIIRWGEVVRQVQKLDRQQEVVDPQPMQQPPTGKSLDGPNRTIQPLVLKRSDSADNAAYSSADLPHHVSELKELVVAEALEQLAGWGLMGWEQESVARKRTVRFVPLEVAMADGPGAEWVRILTSRTWGIITTGRDRLSGGQFACVGGHVGVGTLVRNDCRWEVQSAQNWFCRWMYPLAGFWQSETNEQAGVSQKRLLVASMAVPEQLSSDAGGKADVLKPNLSAAMTVSGISCVILAISRTESYIPQSLLPKPAKPRLVSQVLRSKDFPIDDFDDGVQLQAVFIALLRRM